MSSAALGQVGVPQGGFPSWAERTDLVLTNRARADPVTELAPCKASGDCPDWNCYSPSPPVVYDVTLNHSSRFHVTNLVDSDAMLQHPSPCLLVANIASIYPATCDGSPSCACQGGASLCNCNTCSCDTTQSTCVTQPFDRIDLFNPNGCAENIAAGYSDPQAAFEGWTQEQCAYTGSCGFQACTSGENGHRYNILDPTNTTMGAGSVMAQSGSACYGGEWDAQDYACANANIPKLVAGTHFPEVGTSVQFWANWYDTAPPSSAQIDVGGTCNTMTIDRGVVSGNATYTWQGSIPSGCTAYVFTFKDSSGTEYTVPSAGAYQAGSNCSADYVANAPAPCGGGGGTSGGTTGGVGTSSGGGSTGGPGGSTGTGTSSGGASTGTASSTGAMQGTSGGGSNSSGGSTGGGGSTGASGATPDGGLVGPPPKEEAPASGCGCSGSSRSSSSGAAVWLVLGLVLAVGSRKRRGLNRAR